MKKVAATHRPCVVRSRLRHVLRMLRLVRLVQVTVAMALLTRKVKGRLRESPGLRGVTIPNLVVARFHNTGSQRPLTKVRKDSTISRNRLRPPISRCM